MICTKHLRTFGGRWWTGAGIVGTLWWTCGAVPRTVERRKRWIAKPCVWSLVSSCLLRAALLLFFVLFASVGFLSAAPRTVNLPALRDTLCEWETRGCGPGNRECPPREDARGPGGEIGYCQIKPDTARQIGYRGTWRLLYAELSDERRSRFWALQKIHYCAQPRYRKLDGQWRMTRQGYITPEGLIWCFHYGLDAGLVDKTDPYVVAVAALYRERMKLTAQR